MWIILRNGRAQLGKLRMFRKWQLHKHRDQCFLFQNKIKYFLDTLIQKIFCQIIKINNFRGELTDNSAKKEALIVSWVTTLVAWPTKVFATQVTADWCTTKSYACRTALDIQLGGQISHRVPWPSCSGALVTLCMQTYSPGSVFTLRGWLGAFCTLPQSQTKALCPKVKVCPWIQSLCCLLICRTSVLSTVV